MSFIAELRRRKVFKVGAAYLVVAWLAVQAASIGFPAFDAPPWALRIFILVALLGFPVTLVLAWVFESTPDGVKFDASTVGNKHLLAIAAALVLLAFGWYFIGQPAFRRSETGAQSASSAKAGVEVPERKPDKDSGSVSIPPKSIAVLPFKDMSPEQNQEYFSDGMSEEILNALAQVKALKVAGRTSSFSFKGRNEDLRVIGRMLAVAYVLEGSVRKQGDKVRITAQLIQTSDDTDLWSQTYDGDLGDVFALQERVARAITDQLQVVLQGEQKTRLVPVATTSKDAYVLYLRATDIFNRRDGAHFADAIAALKEAIGLDPEYARAHARLAALYAVASTYSASTSMKHGTRPSARRESPSSSTRCSQRDTQYSGCAIRTAATGLPRANRRNVPSRLMRPMQTRGSG
jgi:TolB-like protein